MFSYTMCVIGILVTHGTVSIIFISFKRLEIIIFEYI